MLDDELLRERYLRYLDRAIGLAKRRSTALKETPNSIISHASITPDFLNVRKYMSIV